jgi:ribosomal-protein-serine acetyltransferase
VTAGERHGLRPLREADADELHAVIERNRAALARWLHWAPGQTHEQTLAFIRSALARESQDGGMERAILAGQRIVGSVGVPAIDWRNRSAPIGYWLDEAHQGQGVMTAAVATVVDHAFERWDLTRLEIRTDIENAASRAVAARLGFHHEGTLRRAYRIDEERYSDDAVYSLLASDRRPPSARLEQRR